MVNFDELLAVHCYALCNFQGIIFKQNLLSPKFSTVQYGTVLNVQHDQFKNYKVHLMSYVHHCLYVSVAADTM